MLPIVKIGVNFVCDSAIPLGLLGTNSFDTYCALAELDCGQPEACAMGRVYAVDTGTWILHYPTHNNVLYCATRK